MEFKEHKVVWDKAKVNNFWDYFVKNKSLFSLSFAGEVGEDIIKRSSKYISGRVLDYGCGGGTLMKYLINKNIACEGLDSSPESIEIARTNVGNSPLCEGLILSSGIPNTNIKDDTYSMVYFIETIEHILPEEIDATLSELYRIVAKDGYVFISTPYNEDRNKYNVICPDCGAIFHRVQHQSTFTIDNMIELTQKAGFKVVKCEATFLMKPTLANMIRKIWRVLSNKKDTPHLIYIGQK